MRLQSCRLVRSWTASQNSLTALEGNLKVLQADVERGICGESSHQQPSMLQPAVYAVRGGNKVMADQVLLVMKKAQQP